MTPDDEEADELAGEFAAHLKGYTGYVDGRGGLRRPARLGGGPFPMVEPDEEDAGGGGEILQLIARMRRAAVVEPRTTRVSG